MPGAITRAKRSTPRGKPASAKLPAANSISSFTRVSKLQVAGKDVLAKSSPLVSGPTSRIEIVLTSRKRKADDDEQLGPSITDSASKKLRHQEPEPEPEAKSIEPVATPSRKRKTVTFAEPEPKPAATAPTGRPFSTPTKLSRKRHLETDENERPTPPSTDPSEAEALFERLNIRSPVHKRTRRLSLQKNTPTEDDYDLPQELLDLLDLQVAFLKTLSMEYAHNGTNSPVDLRTLCPSITRSWGKRKVALDDIRRCIGILSFTSTTQAPFFLCDFGRGKICIEFQPNAEPGPLREQKLNMDFEANLRTLWRGRRQGDSQTALPLFIATLPKAPVKPSATAKSMPIIGKNQRTLEELKNGIMRKQPPAQQTPTTTTTTPTPLLAAAPLLNPDGSKPSLLDRIRAKEHTQSLAAASGPTPQALRRRAALQRADDVAAMIGMLSAATAAPGQARIAFTMPALMVKLKDSLRSPISSEDGVECVRLLAKEVAPGWLRVVQMGGRENVVVQMGLQPSRGEVERRVEGLLGE